MAEEKKNDRPVFTTLQKFEKEYGTRNFVEIALKETNGGENVFFSISKGFTNRNGEKRYKKSLGFTATKDMQSFIVESFKKLMESYKKLPEDKKESKEKQSEKKEEETKKQEE